MDYDWHAVIHDASTDVRRLSSTWRFNSIPVVTNESTSEHSYWVALYSALIHKTVNGPKELLGPLLVHALLHDAADMVGAEVVRTFKYSTPELKKEIDRAEQKLMDSIHNSIGDLVRTANDLNDHNFAHEFIKIVVKAADFLSLYQYMRREVMRGNMEIFPFYKRMISDFSDARNNPVNFNNYFGFCPSHFYDALMKTAIYLVDSCFPNTNFLLKNGAEVT